MTCSNFSGFMLQGVDGNWRQSSVFYLTASLISGGCLLVNYQKSIFHIGNPTIASFCFCFVRLHKNDHTATLEIAITA